ncbi:MAG: glutamine amidotransferase [Candidatus Tokpelaia sp. JSC188]|nr:MAG: glutamine amidotransferase [Candidatus Tokpelaia sp. JSC188]
MRIAIIDYGSGNLRSVAKAFERAAYERMIVAEIEITNDAERIATADKIVLPGVGTYTDCRKGLEQVPGMIAVLEETVLRGGKPFLGICVGMQLLSTRGLEKEVTPGLGWIKGNVVRMIPGKQNLKVPHIGWNTLELLVPHALFKGIPTGPNGLHAYFVHSYHFDCTNKQHRLAITDYGGSIAAAVAHNNLIGTQFHPEKSQHLGLRFIANFLEWCP